MSEDNSWVFDSLLCFLHGPVWNSPLQTFIEEKSLIFDPNQEVPDDNPEYLKIHEEYKNLVDSMLGSFMEEMHITPEQFEMACLESKTNQSESSFRFQQGLFQQIWAANDLKVFVELMTKRNVELQLQALDLLERRQNSHSIEEETNTENNFERNDEDINLMETIAKIEATESATKTEESKHDDEEDQSFERLNLFFDKKKVDFANIQARQKYLRTQRDKIVEIKRKARAKQLNETFDGNDMRPTSAQLARQFLEGNTEEVTNRLDKNDASVQLRKALAKRLRSEVVGQN